MKEQLKKFDILREAVITDITIIFYNFGDRERRHQLNKVKLLLALCIIAYCLMNMILIVINDKNLSLKTSIAVMVFVAILSILYLNRIDKITDTRKSKMLIISIPRFINSFANKHTRHKELLQFIDGKTDANLSCYMDLMKKAYAADVSLVFLSCLINIEYPSLVHSIDDDDFLNTYMEYYRCILFSSLVDRFFNVLYLAANDKDHIRRNEINSYVSLTMNELKDRKTIEYIMKSSLDEVFKVSSIITFSNKNVQEQPYVHNAIDELLNNVSQWIEKFSTEINSVIANNKFIESSFDDLFNIVFPSDSRIHRTVSTDIQNLDNLVKGIDDINHENELIMDRINNLEDAL